MVKGKAAKLKREVNLFTLTLYGIGIILGAGIYALIGKTAGMAGNSMWLSFLFASLVGLFTGLSYAELVSLFPKSAAEYIYVKKSFKNKPVAFSVGWIAIAADVISASVVAIGFAGYLFDLTGIPIIFGALGLIFILSLVNFWGIGESTKLTAIFAVIELIGLLLVIFFAIPHLGSVDYMEMPNGISGVLGASALIFFAFIGFEDIANITEETKDPKNISPKALIFSIFVTTLIYMLVALSAVSLAPWDSLADSNSPLAYAVSGKIGYDAYLLMSIIALFATSNTVLVLLVVGSRVIYGMSNDGSLPKFLSKIHPKRRTPWISVFVVMLIAMSFVFLESIEIVASITDFATFVVFFFVNTSTIILRFTKPNLKRTFRTPLNIGKFPILPFLGLLSIIGLMLHLDPLAIIIGFVIFLAAIPMYYVFRKKSGIKI
jgi:APA family basic amino acid/polyamine antiporter